MCYWKKKQEGFRSSVKSGRPFCEKVFFQCSATPLYTRIHTHTHTHTHKHIVYTSSMGFRFDFFWTPARPRRRADTATAPRPIPRHYTARPDRSFCLLPARRGAERPSALCACVFVCACASSARGDEAAGRPCSHTGSVDGSSSVFRWSSCCAYALYAPSRSRRV